MILKIKKYIIREICHSGGKFCPDESCPYFHNYITVKISSIFLVISWERCSLLLDFIHVCLCLFWDSSSQLKPIQKVVNIYIYISICIDVTARGNSPFLQRSVHCIKWLLFCQGLVNTSNSQ